LFRQVLYLHQALYYFLGVRGYWTDRFELDKLAVSAAGSIVENKPLAWALIDLSWMQIRRNELSDARKSAEDALKLTEGMQDPMAMLTAQRRLSEVDESEGRYSDAEKWLQKALVLNEEVSEPRHTQNAVRLRQSLGNIFYRMHRLDEARTHLHTAMELVRNTGADNWRALILSGLANIARDQKEPDAQQLYEESLALWHRVGQMAELAETKRDYSSWLRKSGQTERAKILLQEAIQLFQRLGVREDAQAAQRLLEEMSNERN
jgi:tetratricopeptide (TPR) repeat protein